MSKDPNYLAKVEKAIAEKYGNIATQNPAHFWNEEKEKLYIAETKEIAKEQQKEDDLQEIQGGEVLIKGKLFNTTSKDDKICPNCKNYLLSVLDLVHMNKFKMCQVCHIRKEG